MHRVAALVVILLTSFTLGQAQSTNASLAGRITDPANALIIDAKVAAISVGTNLRYEDLTNGSGEYYLTNLPPNSYRLEIEKSGFKKLIKPDVILHVQDALRIDLQLTLGDVSETVMVESGAPLVNTESATVSTVIDRAFVENIPLNGRAFQTLIQIDSRRGAHAVDVQRSGTVQRERTACGRKLFHSGRGQREFRRHWIHRHDAECVRALCLRSALQAEQTVWCRWMRCRSFASRRLRLRLSLDARPVVRFRLRHVPEQMLFTARCSNTFAMTYWTPKTGL